MDITVQREALLKPLQAVTGVVEKKQTLPILSNTLLRVENNQLLLSATDLEIELIGFAPLEAAVDTQPTTVSARKLFDICRTLKEGSQIQLVLEKDHLIARAGESCFTLNTLPAQEFPSLEETTYSTQFTLKQQQLKDLLTKTYFAMGQQDVRHYLNGTLLDIGQNKIKCIAADGHRLALTTIESEVGNVEARIILPRKSVLELIRLLTDNDDDATIYIGETRIRVATADFIFTSKLINAQYPDYTRLIPRGDTTLVGDREDIKHALTRAAILSNEKFRGIRFQLEMNKLRITANNSDQEQAEDAVPLEYNGKEMEIGFNAGYLLDVVSAISDKLIRCTLTGPDHGILIEPAENDQSLYVVMPMRL